MMIISVSIESSSDYLKITQNNLSFMFNGSVLSIRKNHKLQL